MNPPRPSLNFEMFEDRLLPSSFALGSSNLISGFSSTPGYYSTWHVPEQNDFRVGSERGNSSHGDSGENQNFGNDRASHGDPNNRQDDNGQGNGDNGQGNNGQGLDGFSQNSSWSDTPIPVSGSFISITFVETITSTSVVLSEIITSYDFEAQSNPGLNEAPKTVPQPNGSADNISADLASVASPAAESSAAQTSPDQFVISLSPTSTDEAMYSAQPPAALDQHLLSEVTLAAISVMGAEGMPSLPSAPSSSGLRSFSISAFDLPMTSTTHEQVSVLTKARVVPVDAPTDIGQPATTLEVQLPAGETVSGTIGNDGSALDASMSHVLDSLSSLSVELKEDLGQTNVYGWVGAAGLLTLGAGYTVWKNQKLQRAVRFPLGRGSMGSWQGEEHDVGGR